MPKIMKIFGPLKTKNKGRGISWSFTGIREGGEFCRWVLWFDAEKRSFKTFRVSPKPGDEKLSEPSLFPQFTSGKPMEGKIGPMLRAQLRPEHIAEATKLALKYGGAK